MDDDVAVAQRVKLTARQEQCLRLVAEGLQYREIADRIGVSHHAVQNYLRMAYARLGVQGRIEALAAMGWTMTRKPEPVVRAEEPDLLRAAVQSFMVCPHCGHERRSLRQAASEIGIAHSALWSYMRGARRPHRRTTDLLRKWVRVNVATEAVA